jgi:hypothetical protein
MTDQGQPTGTRSGGETQPPASSRRLEHPPGDRYAGRPRPVADSGDGGRSSVRAGSPRLGRGLRYGLALAVGVVVVWSVAAGLLDITWGLVVVAGLGGWLIGSAVSAGAWGVGEHEPDARVRMLAAGLGVATWLLGTFGAYLVALAILPGSTAPFAERIANAPFIDALATQFSLFDVAEVALLAVIAWRSAR